ncbi:MAG TPA: TIGR03545 family protein [Bdellovibrionota bacterium]|jgi:uncharacterized protein (TIGR03545 family)
MTNTSAAKKPKGPIRTGALVPSLIFLGLIYAYFFFFFDGYLRRGIEFAATRVHGAEVDVARVHTSFLKATFQLTGLEVTDKEKPERNLFQVGEIRFAALWDALLRGKVAIEEASVLDVQAYTPRKSPGYVLPPPPPSTPGLLAKAQEQILAQTRAHFNQNFLGDIADVAAGTDPKAKLKEIQGNLKTEARAKELEKELEAKQAEWKKRAAELPKAADIQALESKIKALDLSGKNPLELANNLKKAKDIVAEAQGKVKQVEVAQSQLTGDIQKYNNSIADLQRFAQQDVADLQKQLQIPSLDPKEFSRQLFMAQVEKRLGSVRKYIEIARKYMPAKGATTKEKSEELLPPARGVGRTYHFPITKGYPLFWLKQAKVSSEISQSEWAGKVWGGLSDLTSSPSQLGRPTKLHIAGDFPKQNIHGLDLQAVIDHTGEQAKETIKASVAAFPVTDQKFSDSADVKLGVKRATAATSMNGSLVNQSMNLDLSGRLEKPEFEFDAKSPIVKEVLGAALKGLPAVTMRAVVTGSWDKFDIWIDSNLGSELSKGFQKQLQAKLGDAQAKLSSLVNDKIGPSKKKLQDLLGGLSGGPGKAIAQNKGEAEKALKGAQGSATGGKGGSPANLLKGFGF